MSTKLLERKFNSLFRLTRHQMPAGLDLILIPRSPEQPPLAELVESLPKLVAQAARRLEREAHRP